MFPDTVEDFLETNQAKVLEFSNDGAYLAVGSAIGTISVFEFNLKSKISSWRAHFEDNVGVPVSYLSWGADSQNLRLLSCGYDKCIALWDAKTGHKLFWKKFESTILNIQMHPHLDFTFLVCLSSHNSIICELYPELPGNLSGESYSVSYDILAIFSTAVYSNDGSLIVTGNSKGHVTLIKNSHVNRGNLARQVSRTNRLPSGTVVKSIKMSKCGNFAIVNSMDSLRCINLQLWQNLEDLSSSSDYFSANVIHEFCGERNEKCSWKVACICNSGEHVAACTTSQLLHKICIWTLREGSLIKVVQGPVGDGIYDLCWHPIQSNYVSASLLTGLVYVWALKSEESWNSFVPDFTELETNQSFAGSARSSLTSTKGITKLISVAMDLTSEINLD